MQQPPVLDGAVIAELRDIMGGDFGTLIDSYQQDGRHRLEALRQAMAEGHAEGARQQAHSFKGSSGNLGALRVCSLCLEIEHYARAGDLAAVGPRLPALERAFDESCRALGGLMGSPERPTP